MKKIINYLIILSSLISCATTYQNIGFTGAFQVVS